MFGNINLWIVIIIKSMTKNSKNQKNSNYHLVMRPLSHNNNIHYRNQFTLNLRTLAKKSGKKKQTNCNPIFNTDGLPYTPAFIIESDKEIYEVLGNILKNQYLKKIVKTQEISTNLIDANNHVSDISMESKICFVCKDRYLEYEKHISSQKHKQKVKISEYSGHIKNLCKEYSDSISENKTFSFELSEDLEKKQELHLFDFFDGDRFIEEPPQFLYFQLPDNIFEQSNPAYLN